jgi:cytochrome c oxidase cbb3-type subunit 3
MLYKKVRKRRTLAAAVATAAVLLACASLLGQNPAAPNQAALVESGQSLFQRDCAFCHGRDGAGGETGPDLTRSKLVADDTEGSAIAPIVRSGRAGQGMPSFNFSSEEMSSLVAFIHSQKTKVEAQVGGRRGVDAADLQTGDAEAGKRFFNGSGTCSSCHSPTGDLAGIASRFRGLQLEQRMLYPEDVRPRMTVKLPRGQTVTGTLAYQDEFTVALRDVGGTYRSWSTDDVKFTIDAPAEAHVDLFGKYTDADIHNLMAYLQTLR